MEEDCVVFFIGVTLSIVGVLSSSACLYIGVFYLYWFVFCVSLSLDCCGVLGVCVLFCVSLVCMWECLDRMVGVGKGLCVCGKTVLYSGSSIYSRCILFYVCLVCV